jgi:CheY-like chemotaxis protein
MGNLKSDTHYDALIVDNNLPGVSGLELVLRARSMRERRHLPIIMLSADDVEKEAWRAAWMLSYPNPKVSSGCRQRSRERWMNDARSSETLDAVTLRAAPDARKRRNPLERPSRLLNRFNVGGFRKQRIRDRFIVFDRVVGYAAHLNLVAVVIDDEGNRDAIDGDHLVQRSSSLNDSISSVSRFLCLRS